MKKNILLIILTILFILSAGIYLYENGYIPEKRPEWNPQAKYTNYPPDKCYRFLFNQYIDNFVPYFKKYNIRIKARNLKKGMDAVSQEYVDKFIDNSKYWDKCLNHCYEFERNNLWTTYDKQLFQKYKNIQIDIPYPQFLSLAFMYKNLYGMRDLPKEVLDGINGKDIIDGGAYIGDTAYLFYKTFPDSVVYSYEPMESFYLELVDFIKKLKQPCHIIPIKNALGNTEKTETIEFPYHDTYKKSNVKFVTLDKDYVRRGGKNLGLIKLDTEGYEMETIEGAEKIIKKYKPVLVISMYHTPEEFFGLKHKIKKINKDYKFMIRRCEDINPDINLVLIAY